MRFLRVFFFYMRLFGTWEWQPEKDHWPSRWDSPVCRVHCATFAVCQSRGPYLVVDSTPEGPTWHTPTSVATGKSRLGYSDCPAVHCAHARLCTPEYA